MTQLAPPSQPRESSLCACLVVILATVVALVSARSYAGSWNDGSRLATVECLVDHQTLAIDDAIFVRVPAPSEGAAGPPYPAHEPNLLAHGTADKLFIDGHYYSDKSPVPALLMAVAYKGLQMCCGLRAREQPGLFCYGMTLATSGLAYVVAVWCMYRLGLALVLPLPLRLGLTASFGLTTVALPYGRHVNNHILLLAVSAALLLQLAGRANGSAGTWLSRQRLLVLGSLAGLGYGIDLAAGPLLLFCTGSMVVYASRQLRAVLWFGLAALPWLLLHHGVNLAIGGTWKPANAVAEYFLWPGCPFTPEGLTGSWQHKSLGHFAIYAAGLLVGKRGFLGHNLTLFLALPGLVLLLRQRARELPELLFAACWSGCTWLAYAITSTNSSGLCCSVRWFVPLLAPGYYILAVLLRQDVASRRLFGILGGWGAILAAGMWWQGPWMKHMVPFFWPLQVAALLHTALAWVWQLRRAAGVAGVGTPARVLHKAA